MWAGCAPRPAETITSPAVEKAAPARVSNTPLFNSHSDPWLNLHQRLLAEAQADASWHTRVDPCACARTLEGTALPAWAGAVDAYRALFKDRDPTFDRSLALTNLALALAGDRATLSSPYLDKDVARLLPTVFEPYSRAGCEEDDARNRAWIAAVGPLVARWGNELAADGAPARGGLAERAHPVEVSRFAGWAGAYTTSRPILTTGSSDDPGYQGPAALEMLFTKRRTASPRCSITIFEMAFLARGKEAPRGLEHVIIFYTAGELVRRRLGPSYVPYAEKNGVYKRAWPTLEPVVRMHWQPWLDGSIDLPTALARLAQAL